MMMTSTASEPRELHAPQELHWFVDPMILIELGEGAYREIIRKGEDGWDALLDEQANHDPAITPTLELCKCGWRHMNADELVNQWALQRVKDELQRSGDTHARHLKDCPDAQVSDISWTRGPDGCPTCGYGGDGYLEVYITCNHKIGPWDGHRHHAEISGDPGALMYEAVQWCLEHNEQVGKKPMTIKAMHLCAPCLIQRHDLCAGHCQQPHCCDGQEPCNCQAQGCRT